MIASWSFPSAVKTCRGLALAQQHGNAAACGAWFEWGYSHVVIRAGLASSFICAILCRALCWFGACFVSSSLFAQLALAFIGGGFLTSAQRWAEIRNQGHDAQPSFALQHDIRLGLDGNHSRAR